MFYFGLMMLFFGFVSLVYNRSHFLSLLLSLEMMMLGLFMLLISHILALHMAVLVLFFIIIVCEASLGLSILVTGVYFFGSDYSRSEMTIKC